MATHEELETFLPEDIPPIKAHHGHLLRPSWARDLENGNCSKGKRSLLSHVIVFALTSALWVVSLSFMSLRPSWPSKSASLSQHNSTRMPGRNFYSCGDNTETAKARGCKYDILDNSWVPAECIDQEAIEEYQSDLSWFGFSDANHTQPLSIDEMSETPWYYTSQRDHIVHCAMLWRKQFRALIGDRKYMDSVILEEEHTIHCSQFLMDMTPNQFREKPIETQRGFSGCHIKEQEFDVE